MPYQGSPPVLQPIIPTAPLQAHIPAVPLGLTPSMVPHCFCGCLRSVLGISSYFSTGPLNILTPPQTQPSLEILCMPLFPSLPGPCEAPALWVLLPCVSLSICLAPMVLEPGHWDRPHTPALSALPPPGSVPFGSPSITSHIRTDLLVICLCVQHELQMAVRVTT